MPRDKLKYIVVLSFVIAFVYHLFIANYITPAFKEIFVDKNIEEAQLIGRHMSKMLMKNRHNLPGKNEFPDSVHTWIKEFHLEKLKIFSSDGEIIYSTAPEDVGKLNTKSYFFDIVAKGLPYSKIVEKDKRTLEGRVVKADVIESYIPIMSGSNFIGAVEVYYDITKNLNEVNRTAEFSTISPLIFILFFLLSVLAILFMSDRKIDSYPSSDPTFKEHSPYYFLFICIVSIFVAELYVMAMLSKWQTSSWITGALIDAALLSLTVTPILYLFINRPLLLHIAQRKKAEKALQESEERFRDLFENSTDLIQSIAPDGSILFVNPIWKKTLLYSDEDITQMNIFDILAPEYQEHCKTTFQQVMTGQPVDRIEAALLSKDGRKIIVEGSASCKMKDGIPQYTRAIFHDITEQRTAEEEKEKLITELQKSLADIKTLSGLLPICSWCKKIRDDKGYWSQVESYIGKHSEIAFSHSVCPDCMKEHYPEVGDIDLGKTDDNDDQ